MNRLPTTDLYFLNACRHRLRRWRRRGAFRALGANTFACGDAVLLIRRDTDAVMRRALDGRHRLIYLIDDDIAGAAESAGLPDDYRRRLARFDGDFHQALVARADRLVVASPVMRDIHAGHPSITLVDPYWDVPPADTAHFRGAGIAAPIRIAHLGTGSHDAGLAALVPALLRLLADGRDVTFAFVSRAGVHPALDTHPRAIRIAPRRWPAYRRWVGRQRFHIGLYPLADTPFDRARSANKLIEHAIVGAAGIYPQTWPAAQRMADGAILAPASPADWWDVLASATDDVARLERTAAAALQQLPTVNNAARQRATWSDLLDIMIE